MQFTTLETKLESGVYYARINRPEAANKLSIECMQEIQQALADASAAKCNGIILLGQQDMFCSGGELGDFRKKSSTEIMAFGNAFIALHLAICNCPIPVIAAVEGDALGGGFSLVEACDFAVGAKTAEFAIPEILNGLAPAMGLSGIFSNLTKKQVMELGLWGTSLSADRAVELGLLNFAVSRDEVLPKAVWIARQFENASPTAVRLFKELYVDMGLHAYDARLKMGRSMMLELFKSIDGAEVLNSKEEGRAPVWSK